MKNTLEDLFIVEEQLATLSPTKQEYLIKSDFKLRLVIYHYLKKSNIINLIRLCCRVWLLRDKKIKKGDKNKGFISFFNFCTKRIFLMRAFFKGIAFE